MQNHNSFNDDRVNRPGGEELPPGGTELIGDRYEVIEVLGQGGMGTVLKARHANLSKIVAIKVLNTAVLVDETSKARFEIEAKAGSKLCHPHLVQVFDYGFTRGGEPYLVMEFIQGESLEQIVSEYGRLSSAEFLATFTQICRALHFIHSNNIVHRDLKPSNIMIQIIGEERYAKLLDFGIAKVLSDSDYPAQHLTATGAVFGSPLYMSPEQCQGNKTDARSDIYSLGVVMYRCLAGVPPFCGENALQTIFKHVSAKPEPIPCQDDTDSQIAAIVYRCLEKDAAARFQSANDLLAALNKIAQSSTSPTLSQIDDEERRQLKLLQERTFKKQESTDERDITDRRDVEHNRVIPDRGSDRSRTNRNLDDSRELTIAKGRNIRAATAGGAPPPAWAKHLPSLAAIAAFLVFVPFAATYLSKTFKSFTFNNAVTQGENDFQQAKWKEAETQFESALRSAPEDDDESLGKLRARLGRINFQQGRNEEALTDFVAATKQLEGLKNKEACRDYYIDAVFGEAQALSSAHKYHEAVEKFGQAVTLSSKWGDHLQQAEILFASGKNETKLNHYAKAMHQFDQAVDGFRHSQEKPADRIAAALLESAEIREQMRNSADAALRAQQAVVESANISNNALKSDIQARASLIQQRNKTAFTPQTTPSFVPSFLGTQALPGSSPGAVSVPPVQQGSMPSAWSMPATGAPAYPASSSADDEARKAFEAARIKAYRDAQAMQEAASANFRATTRNLDQLRNAAH